MKLFFYDLETTGLDCERHGIHQISGAIVIDGETVLDNTMGSGSTGVACVNTNRNFIGIELNEEYFKIAEKRIAQAISEKEGCLF